MAYLNGIGTQLRISGASKSGATKSADNTVSTGNGDNNVLHSTTASAPPSTLIGRGGDDIYHLWSKATVVEAAGEGRDTVVSHIETTYLADNVENLTLDGAYARFGIGNALDNILTAGSGGSELNGGKGDDVLIGGAGKDVFVVRKNEGSDAVYAFDVAQDKLRLSGFGFDSFAEVKARMTQNGSDAVLDLGDGQKLVLRDVKVDHLSSNNFALELDRSALKLTFEENFDTLVTQSQGGFWRTDWGNGGSSDNYRPGEVGAYVDAAFRGSGANPLGINPFSIDRGVLSITATPAGTLSSLLSDRTYTTGVLSTKDSFSQKYGYFEIRATLPEGKGFLPAFWLKSADGRWPPELDVVEAIGDRSDTIYLSSHTAETGQHTMQSQTTHVDSGEPHTYGMNWTKDALIWYVDGVEVARAPSPSDATAEFYMMINLAVGGSWPGAPDATTGTGAFKVDYVRVYANSDTESYTSKGETVYLSDAVPHTMGTFGDDLLTGGAGADVMDGRAGHDRMFGGAGNDTMTGGAGNDLLDGGTGADTMTGGDGDDTYYVDDAGDRIVEYANGTRGGYDKVFAAVDYTLTANVEDLTLIGNARSGTGTEQDNVLTANDLGNTLRGLGGHDTLLGGRGDDLLDGGTGNDKLYGGAGNDTLLGGDGTDLLQGGDGNDRLFGGDGYDTLEGGNGDDYLDGGAQNDRLFGGAGRDQLFGGSGNDTLDGGTGADQMAGGDGDDTYYVDDAGDKTIETANGGDDVVYASTDYVLGDHVETLRLIGAALNGTGNAQNNVLYGNAGDNRLSGGDGNDTLYGDLGNDSLNGGTGADRMYGGDGDDVYFVDNIGDQIVEYFNNGLGGRDKVYSAIDYALGSNLEDLTLLDGAVAGTGNGSDNVLAGNAADNILSGLGGNDTLYGDAGNDTLYGGQGLDRLYGGQGDDQLFGEDGDDTLYGDDGNDILRGGSGNDVLSGGAGDDTLDGGTGLDRMSGGDGDDVYYVDNAGDIVTEYHNGGLGGYDKVFSTVSYTLSDSVEDLTLLGGATNGTGNASNNVLTGNDLNNTLSGMDGNDVIYGGGGNDTLYGGDGWDRLYGGSGNDTLYGGDTYDTLSGDDGDDKLYGENGDDWLMGGAGNDVLDGGTGADRMEGGDGNDVYYVDNAGDAVTEYVSLGQGGRDRVVASIDYALGQNVEDLTLIGTAIRATGNALDNVIIGNQMANVINGQSGNDRLTGGGGADLFIFSGQSGKDVITDFDRDDRIDLSGWLAQGDADLKKLSIVDTAHGTVLSMNGYGSIELLGVSASQLAIKAGGIVTHA